MCRHAMIRWCDPELISKGEWNEQYADPIMQGKQFWFARRRINTAADAQHLACSRLASPSIWRHLLALAPRALVQASCPVRRCAKSV